MASRICYAASRSPGKTPNTPTQAIEPGRRKLYTNENLQRVVLTSLTNVSQQHGSPRLHKLVETLVEATLDEASAAPSEPESPARPGRSDRRSSTGRRSSTSSAGSGWERAAVLLAQLDEERERRVAAEAEVRGAREAEVEARADVEACTAARSQLQQENTMREEEAARLPDL